MNPPHAGRPAATSPALREGPAMIASPSARLGRLLVASFSLGLGALLLVPGAAPPPARAEAPAKPAIDFTRQIRPILAENCFACHGPDDKARKKKLRLDTKEGALGHAGLITPGKADESGLIARVTSKDPDE